MFSTIRARVTYANVAATLALFLSLGGSAIAASHYLITSRKQISPTVLKTLKGKPGATGPSGATGATGPVGAAGAAGAPGSARAFALVFVNGAGNPSLSEGAGFSSVTQPQAGIFCLNPAIPGHTPVVSSAGSANVFTIVSPQQCPGGNEIESLEPVSAGSGFSVLVP